MLTVKEIEAAQPREKQYKINDGGGLYLVVSPAGGKLWRYRYEHNKKEKMLSLGQWPLIGLKEARVMRDDAKRLQARGIDPAESKQAQKKAAKAAGTTQAQPPAGDSFEMVAREWYEKWEKTKVDAHSERILRRLERDLFPHLRGQAIATIKVPDLLDVLRKIEERGAVETAHRVLQNLGMIWRYATATGRVERDITVDLRGALTPYRGKNLGAITAPESVGPLLRAIQDYNGQAVTRYALQLAPLFFVRPGELRKAEWREIDFDAGEWTIPAERMKMRASHIVPLASQAAAILRDLQVLTGNGKYVFPSARSASRPMSDNAVLAALRRMGFEKDEMTGHGFRAMARTILDEVLNYPPHIIEQQLAHAVKDPLGRAYNRTAHLPQRRQMMQAWADYLDKLAFEN